ncbi:MlaD family protein [Viscerimonas tarda]
MKRKIAKEVKIGISFIVCVFILYFGISFLKGVNLFKPTNSYLVVFEDVTDLTLSSPVILNGYKVGTVYDMNIDEANPRWILTVINLDRGVRIPKGSRFEIQASVLGSATVVIRPNYETSEFYSATDTIRGKRPLGMLETVSNDLMPQIAVLIPHIDSILIGLERTVNHPALNQSLDNIGSATTELKTSMKQLNALLATLNHDVPAITKNLTAISNDLSAVTSQAKSIDLASAYNSLDSTLNNIQALSEKINSKDNSMGLLLNDTQLHDSLTSTLNNASLLLKDIKENPSRYIKIKVF